MTVYPADRQHYSEIISVWEASVRATHHFLTEKEINFFRPLIVEQYLPAVNAYYLSDINGKMMGFIGVAENNIEMLFIHPDYRGQGVGKQLLNYALKTLNAKFVDVNEQNQQAVDFYLHMGFQVINRSETDGMGKPFPLLHLAYTQ